MYHFVYILISEKWRYYIWYTCDLERRFKEHCSWNCFTTSKMWKIKLIWYFEFKDKNSALVFEKKIKNSWHTTRFLNHTNFIKYEES